MSVDSSDKAPSTLASANCYWDDNLASRLSTELCKYCNLIFENVLSIAPEHDRSVLQPLFNCHLASMGFARGAIVHWFSKDFNAGPDFSFMPLSLPIAMAILGSTYEYSSFLVCSVLHNFVSTNLPADTDMRKTNRWCKIFEAICCDIFRCFNFL